MTLGEWGENKAAAYLEGLGWTVLERNFRCRIGELDLVAMDGDCLVFLEVKTRRSLSCGLPCESITPEKQRHILRTARYYCMKNLLEGQEMRVDVIEILKYGERAWLRHTRNAFGD